MIKVDGKRTNLEGGDELLQRELTLLIAVMKSRLESKGQNDAEADAFVQLSVEKGIGDLDRLRTVEEYGKEKFVYSEKCDRGRGVSGWEIWGSGGSKGEEKEGNPGAGGKGESV